jgi:hypothetical protein
MRTVIITALLALGVATGFAQTQQPKEKPLNITGKWTMTLEMEMGTATPALEFAQDGEKVTGSYTGRYGKFPLAGTLKDKVLEFAFTMDAEGTPADMYFKAEVAADAQSMKGTASLDGMGEATWTAKRAK